MDLDDFDSLAFPETIFDSHNLSNELIALPIIIIENYIISLLITTIKLTF